MTKFKSNYLRWILLSMAVFCIVSCRETPPTSSNATIANNLCKSIIQRGKLENVLVDGKIKAKWSNEYNSVMIYLSPLLTENEKWKLKTIIGEESKIVNCRSIIVESPGHR